MCEFPDVAIPVQPLSFQSLRCLVRPSITYLESEIQHSGTVRSANCSAITRAASSLVWLDWLLPGILIARFSGWFSPNHIPPPHFASNLLLLKHDPSVYMVTGAVGIPLILGCCRCHAGSSDILLLLVSMQMDSLMLCFVVRDGSKAISSPLSRTALWFFSFWWWVRERLSFCGFVSGSNFISIIPMMLQASSAHLCGF